MGRGGGLKGQDRPPQPRDVIVSKALSFLLRHGGKGEGVEMDEGGWAEVEDVVGFFHMIFRCFVKDFGVLFLFFAF